MGEEVVIIIDEDADNDDIDDKDDNDNNVFNVENYYFFYGAYVKNSIFMSRVFNSTTITKQKSTDFLVDEDTADDDKDDNEIMSSVINGRNIV